MNLNTTTRFFLFVLLFVIALTVGCSDDPKDENEDPNTEVPDPEVPDPEVPVGELDGFWKVDNTWGFEIKGDSGILLLLDVNAYESDLGYLLHIGDVCIKDLEKASSKLWSGSDITWERNDSTGRLELKWFDGLYLLNETKDKLSCITPGYEGIIYHKVNDINDPVPGQLKSSTIKYSRLQ
jgi:hypothetical protein